MLTETKLVINIVSQYQGHAMSLLLPELGQRCNRVRKCEIGYKDHVAASLWAMPIGRLVRDELQWGRNLIS